jgi:hypothetical protein
MESLKFIKSQVNQYFHRHQLPAPVYHFDPVFQPRLAELTRREMHLVVGGEGIRSFADENSFVDETKYHLYVLCSAVKNLLDDFLCLDPTVIQTLPRYGIVPTAGNALDINSIRRIVVPGRNRPGKNIGLSLDFAVTLGETLDVPVIVMGDRTGELLASIPRDVRRVTFMGDTGTAWLKHAQDSLVVSLSLYPFEDFSVIAAEAQRARLPLVLSNWFGHRDVAGGGVWKLSIEEVESCDFLRIMSGILTKDPSSAAHCPQLTLSPPKPMRGRELRNHIRKLRSDKRNQLFQYFRESSIFFGEDYIQKDHTRFPDVVRHLGGG